MLLHVARLVFFLLLYSVPLYEYTTNVLNHLVVFGLLSSYFGIIKNVAMEMLTPVFRDTLVSHFVLSITVQPLPQI